jgi:O-antigen ligase
MVKAHVFSVLAFSIFGLMFAMRPATWLPTLIFFSCAVAVLFSATFRRKVGALVFDKDLRWIVFPFVAWFGVCLFVGFWHWGFAKYAFPENPFRIFLALGTLGLTVHAIAKKSFITGLLVASVCVVLNVLYGHMIHNVYYPRISGTTNHPIHFGNFAALLAVLLSSVTLLGRTYKTNVRTLCLIGAFLALAAIVASQSRSSFGVLLCLLPLVFVVKTDMMHRWLVRVGCGLAFGFVLLVAISPSIQESLRIKEAIVDVNRIESRDYEGSIGSRLSMWQAAWSMFQTHPIVGIGPHKFQAEFVRRMQSGESKKADADHNQPHNDILNAAATGGILKLLAYLFLIAAPFVFFYKRYKAIKLDLDKRMLPMMGMQVVGAFFISGLTNSNFDLQIYSTTYAVLVCVLARLSVFEINAAAPSTPLAQVAPNC